MAVVADDLPPELLDVILARLPLRDAARASVLSAAWGRSWRDLSDIDFTSSSPRDDRAAIDAVLAGRRRSGASPVRRARLNVTDGLLPGVHGWIEALSEKKMLQSLDLNFNAVSSPPRPTLPSSVFACGGALKHLVLTCCVLPALPAPPASSSTGFLPSLTKLCLIGCIFAKGGDVEAMIAMPRNLEELTMRVIHVAEQGWHELRMESSSLRFLEMEGHGTIRWVAARLPRLGHANLIDANRDSVANLLRGMVSSVENLLYNYYRLQVPLPKELPASYENLRRLILRMDFNNAPDISTTMYFLRSARKLAQLVVEDTNLELVEDCPYSWAVGSSELCPSLRFLHVSIVPLCNALGFMRLVLSKARALQIVEVDIRRKRRTKLIQEDITQEVQEEICRYHRVSPEAQIHFKDWYKGDYGL